MTDFPIELGAFWLIAWLFVAWWASAWGRSVFWALVGGLILSPVIWGAVLLVLGRRDAD